MEHILLENPSQEWEQTFPQSQWEAAVYRLGNLTLLRAAANRRARNASYREKVSIYQQSAYQLTKNIAELAPEEWTMELLERRQRDLVRIATMVLRIDVG
ncbi:HNH endonuclease family protein [uncultured Chloroflexus sp.]|uniref:HNH endonuclease family protein n=1 Tax=uncultured Chloroflexus sp. TaxID=214040 RepID=UPI002626F6D5|nr:HNH endonuclease family protein [uncultured Chloroflexus sp.]